MCVCVIDHAAMLCNMFYNMESQRGQNPIIMDLHNWIMDLKIMDHNGNNSQEQSQHRRTKSTFRKYVEESQNFLTSNKRSEWNIVMIQIASSLNNIFDQ